MPEAVAGAGEGRNISSPMGNLSGFNLRDELVVGHRVASRSSRDHGSQNVLNL